MPPRRREPANRGFVFPRSASVRWSDTEQLYAYAEIILIYSVVIVSLRKTKTKTPFFFFFSGNGACFCDITPASCG